MIDISVETGNPLFNHFLTEVKDSLTDNLQNLLEIVNLPDMTPDQVAMAKKIAGTLGIAVASIEKYLEEK